MGAQDATLVSMVNTGVALTSRGDVVLASFSNVGIRITRSPDATLTEQVNVGFELPPMVDVVQPQTGWGTPMVPSREVTLVPQSAEAMLYNFENVEDPV